jgi:protein-disulfide isomerase
MDRKRSGLTGLRTSLELVTTLVLLVAGLVVLSDRRGPVGTARAAPVRTAAEAPLPADPVPLEGSAVKGSSSARVAMIEFAEFECPYCLRFVQHTLPALTTKYVDTGQVALAFRHFPLESIHRQAFQASEAAECARRQGRFWEMHDQVFDGSAQLDPAGLLGRARAIGLDMDTFETCLAGAAAPQVRRDQSLGQAVGVRGTPAFLIGLVQDDGTVRVTHRLSGARPLADYEAALDAALAQATSSGR